MNLEAAPPLPERQSSSSWLRISVGIVLLFALGAAAWRGWVVRAGNGGGGAGTAMGSPHEEYLAETTAVTEDLFWGGQRQYFRLTVMSRDPLRYQPERTVVVDRLAGLPFPNRRSDLWVIQWLPDASQVTFVLEGKGVSVSISTKDL